MKNHKTYYQAVHGRINLIREYLMMIFILISSLPALIVEVFLRKNFGERYINTGSILAAWYLMMNPYLFFHFKEYSFGFLITWMPKEVIRYGDDIFNLPYALFCTGFLIFALYHRLQFKRYLNAEFDQHRFSLSRGIPWRFWSNRMEKKVLGIEINPYTLVVIFEPSIPLVTGLVLTVFPETRGLGGLVIIGALSYAIRGMILAIKGREYFLDKLDELIMKEELGKIILDAKQPHETRGASLPFSIPQDRKNREVMFRAIGFGDDSSSPKLIN